MTNGTEAAKREMYDHLKTFRYYAARPGLADIFESALEAYLEELRKERDFIDSVVALSEAKAAKAIEERDDLRNKLQAMQHSKEDLARANLMAGEELRRLQAIVAVVGEHTGTSLQDRAENVSSDAQGGNALMIVLGALVDSQRIVTDWLVPDGIGTKKAMSRLVAVLDNETLVNAQKAFESCDHRWGPSGSSSCTKCGELCPL